MKENRLRKVVERLKRLVSNARQLFGKDVALERRSVRWIIPRYMSCGKTFLPIAKSLRDTRLTRGHDSYVSDHSAVWIICAATWNRAR